MENITDEIKEIIKNRLNNWINKLNSENITINWAESTKEFIIWTHERN